MVSERIRIFKGANELKYASCKIYQTNDFLVNKAKLDVLGEYAIESSDTLDFKLSDGVTTIFSADIIEKNQDLLWKLKAMSAGFELLNIRIERVYTDKSPEYIVQDIIDNDTVDLTYASTASSGITIAGNYIAKGYAMEIIQDMLGVLEWQIRIDESGNFYFEPSGEVDNGVTFVQGESVNIKDWQDDTHDLVNKVRIVGNTIELNTSETVASTGSIEYTLTKKPVNTVRVTVNGTEKTGGLEEEADFKVDKENKKIIFSTGSIPSAGDTIIFYYSYAIQIVVQDQDDYSITKYKERFKEVSVPGIETFSAARKFATNYLAIRSIPSVTAKGIQPGLDFDRQAGELVTVRDDIRNFDQKMVITKIVWNAEKTQTEYEFGTRDFVFVDWQKEVQERIKKLERKTNSDQEPAFARTITSTLQVDLKPVYTAEYSFPVNSFSPLHESLGYAKANFETEIDCSGSENHGTWSGTGVTSGNQFLFYDYLTDLIAWWKLDDYESTTVILDSFGSYNGTASHNTSTTSSTGVYGLAFNFNETATRYILMDDTALDSLDDFAIEFEFKTSETDYSTPQFIMTGARAAELKEFAVEIVSSTSLKIHIKGTSYTYTGLSAINSGSFQKYIISRNGTTLTLWQDGADQGDKTVSTTALSIDANGWVLGQEQGSVGGGFTKSLNGDLDNIRLFNNYLSDEQVAFINSDTNSLNYRLSYGIFNGSDRYITVSDSADLDITTDLTIFLGIRVSALPSAERYLIDKYDGTDGYAIRIKSDNTLELVYGDSGAESTIASTTALTTDTFYTFAFIKNGTDLTVYVDSVSDNTGTGGATIGTNNDDLIIGKSGATYFSGDLDEIRIYDNNKTQTDITNLHAKIDVATDLVCWLSMDNPVAGDQSTTRKEVS